MRFELEIILENAQALIERMSRLEFHMNVGLLGDSVAVACREVHSFQIRYTAEGRLTRIPIRAKVASTDRSIVQSVKAHRPKWLDQIICYPGSGGGADLKSTVNFDSSQEIQATENISVGGICWDIVA